MKKHILKKDKYAEREAKKYKTPIASREYILSYLEKSNTPLSYQKLADEFEIEDETEREALTFRLKAMLRDGQLLMTRRKAYAVVKKMQLVRGRVLGHRDGYGFVIPEEEGSDVFLAAQQMRSVLHGDRVLVCVTDADNKGRRYGSVVEVLERNTQQLVGRFFFRGGAGFVTPYSKHITNDIVIPTDQQNNAKEGQIVSIDLIAQPDKHRKAVGRVSEVLGENMAAGMEIDIAIRNHGLPNTWSRELLDEVKAFGSEVKSKELVGREDLTDKLFVTIDGEDARDFDDAVYCEARKGGWRLRVAIADVANYVNPGTAIEEEAEKRGNSVYFPGNVIPMLPEILSNELCSLNPNVKRLVLVCEMLINKEGEVTAYDFSEAVIFSHARLTYTEAAEIISKESTNKKERSAEVVAHLKELNELYKALYKARKKRGAIEFETIETQIIFDENRKIKNIVPVNRNDAHKLIEECMLAANVSAANFLLKKKIVGLFRVHYGPSQAKLENLQSFLRAMGLSLTGGENPTPADYSKLMDAISARADANIIQIMMLRSLSQAVYHPENAGHFGLGYDAYAHFTSPIRRYPDLLMHRAIKHIINGGSPAKFPYETADMARFGEHCSMTERRADEATRDATDCLKCEYIHDRLGETLKGIVTTVTGFGLFVSLKDIYVEGLVHISALDNDYYAFDPITHRLTGEKTGVVYQIGSLIDVVVAKVDLDERKIDFTMPTTKAKPEKKAKKRKKWK